MAEKKYVSDFEAKELLIEFGRRLYQRGLVDGNGGNITCRVGDNEVWATPTMESKGYMNKDMLVKIDMDGNPLIKSEYRVSSEIKMHLGVLKENQNANCVLHAHPPYAAALAVIGEDVKNSLLPTAMGFGDAIHVTDFAMPGTFEVPESVIPYCKEGTGVLLGNHGALTWGATLKDAYFFMESLENYCHVYFLANYVAGKYRDIPEDQEKEMRAFIKQILSGKNVAV